MARLEQAKAKLQASQLHFNALDESTNITVSRKAIHDSIAILDSAHDSVNDCLAHSAGAAIDICCRQT